jgi:Secretion system C-terminal sorting domain
LLVVESNAFNGAIRKYDLYSEDYLPSALISSTSNPVTFVDVVDIATKDLVIKNDGEIDMTVTAIDINVDLDEVFTLDAIDFPVVIKPGKDSTFKLNFLPKHRTEYYGEVTVESDAYNEPEYVFIVNATSDQPSADPRFEKSTLTIGSTPTNVPKEKFFFIDNKGDFTASIEELICEDCGETFKFKDLVYPITIDAGGDYKVTFIFAPDEIETYNAEVTMKSNALSDDGKVLKLVGRGTKPVSVEEQEAYAEFKMTISPNPASSTASLSYDYKGNVQRTVEIKLLDIQGREIMKLVDTSINAGNYIETLNLNELPSATYLIVAKVGDKTYQTTLKVVK